MISLTRTPSPPDKRKVGSEDAIDVIPDEHFETDPVLQSLVITLEEELGNATKSTIHAMVRDFGRQSVYEAHDRCRIGDGPALELMMKQLKLQRLNEMRSRQKTTT